MFSSVIIWHCEGVTKKIQDVTIILSLCASLLYYNHYIYQESQVLPPTGHLDDLLTSHVGSLHRTEARVDL